MESLFNKTPLQMADKSSFELVNRRTCQLILAGSGVRLRSEGFLASQVWLAITFVPGKHKQVGRGEKRGFSLLWNQAPTLNSSLFNFFPSISYYPRKSISKFLLNFPNLYYSYSLINLHSLSIYIYKKKEGWIW